MNLLGKYDLKFIIRDKFKSNFSDINMLQQFFLHFMTLELLFYLVLYLLELECDAPL